MIYTSNSTTEVTIPRITDNQVTTLRLRNQTTSKETTLAVTDLTPSKSYYTFDLTGRLQDLDNGQYDATVEKDGVVYASVILQHGEYEMGKTSHTTTINIKEYNG